MSTTGAKINDNIMIAADDPPLERNLRLLVRISTRPDHGYDIDGDRWAGFNFDEDAVHRFIRVLEPFIDMNRLAAELNVSLPQESKDVQG